MENQFKELFFRYLDGEKEKFKKDIKRSKIKIIILSYNK